MYEKHLSCNVCHYSVLFAQGPLHAPVWTELVKKSNSSSASSLHQRIAQPSQRNRTLIMSVLITHCPDPLGLCLHGWLKTEPASLPLHLEMPRHMLHLTGFKDVFLWVTNTHSSDSKYQQERVPGAFPRAISCYPSGCKTTPNSNGRDVVPSKSWLHNR